MFKNSVCWNVYFIVITNVKSSVMKEFWKAIRKDNMKFKDYSWDKEFEIKGYFSESPDDIANKNNLSGILHCSQEKLY